MKSNTAEKAPGAEQAPAGSNALSLVDELIELAPKSEVDFQVLKRYDSGEIGARFVAMRAKLLALRAAIETDLG